MEGLAIPPVFIRSGNMATAIYIRVSTERQEEKGVSLETQREQLNAYCTLKGLKDVREYLDIGSARTTNRVSFKRMIKDVEKGFIENIIVLKLDRLTRSIIDLNKLVKKLNDLECGLHSAVENIDSTTATGRMIINLIGTFAQWESETISERVSTNMMTNAKKGIWQSVVPFGFYLNGEKKLEIKEDEANILREAFDMILDGNSYSYTEKYISNKYNLLWRENYLSRKVRTQTLIGNIERNGEIIENTHNGIISKKEQYQLLQRLEENRNGRTSNIIHNDIFRRKIKCPNCNYNLAMSTVKSSTKEYVYNYVCNNCRDKKGKTVSITEKRILKALYKFMKVYTTERFDGIKINEVKPTKKLKTRLKEIQNERDRIQRAWIKKLMNDGDLEKYQKELDKEQLKIEDELNKLEAPVTTKSELKELVATFNDHFEELTRDEKRSFVQRFIKSIEFNRELVEGYKKKYNVEVTDVVFY